MTEIGESPFLPIPSNKQEQDLVTSLQSFNKVIALILNRGITFGDNVDCKLVAYTSNGVVNTQDSVAHTLGRTPTGFIVYDIDKAGVVYRSAASDATNLYLKNSAVSVAVKIIVF